MDYEIVLGKDVKANDIIILNSTRCKVLKTTQGQGMGSDDFGIYISIQILYEGNYENIHRRNIFMSCPYVKEIECPTS